MARSNIPGRDRRPDLAARPGPRPGPYARRGRDLVQRQRRRRGADRARLQLAIDTIAREIGR